MNPRPEPHQEEDPPATSPWRALIGLLVFAAVIALVMIVVFRLQSASKIQDCVMAGRTNCAPYGQEAR